MASSGPHVPSPLSLEEQVLQQVPRYRWTADAVATGIDLMGKNVIVTGGTSGIGIPTALGLARTKANITFTARDPAKGAPLVDSVKEKTGNPNIRCLPLDLCSYQSVVEFLRLWNGAPVDVLVHNAGVMACPFTLTADGDEQQMQVNFFSIVLLTERLRPLLSPHSRVVIVSSSAHKRIPPAADFKKLREPYLVSTPDAANYDKWTAYAVSKSLAIMYSNALNSEFVRDGLSARSNALHPGGIMTGLQTHLSKEELAALGWVGEDGKVMPLFKTLEQGAATTVWAAVSPELTGRGGCYLENCEVTPPDSCGAAGNDTAAALLSRLRGTAPHVWDLEDSAAIAEAGRAHLRAKGFL